MENMKKEIPTNLKISIFSIRQIDIIFLTLPNLELKGFVFNSEGKLVVFLYYVLYIIFCI